MVCVSYQTGNRMKTNTLVQFGGHFGPSYESIIKKKHLYSKKSIFKGIFGGDISAGIGFFIG